MLHTKTAIIFVAVGESDHIADRDSDNVAPGDSDHIADKESDNVAPGDGDHIADEDPIRGLVLSMSVQLGNLA